MDKIYYFHILFKYGHPSICDFEKFKSAFNKLCNEDFNMSLFPIFKKKAIEQGVINYEIQDKDRDLDNYFLGNNGYIKMYLLQLESNIITAKKNKLCWCKFIPNRCRKCHSAEIDNIGFDDQTKSDIDAFNKIE